MHTLLAMPLGAIRFKVFCPRTLQHADDCQKMGSEALGVVIFSWILQSTPSKGILPFFLGFLCFVLHGSHSLKDVWGLVPCVSDVDWGGFPGPLLSAALLGKYSTLGTDRLLRRCLREYLVMAFRARTPAEFTELSVSPVTGPCFCASLLEPLDMLNTLTYSRDQVFYMVQHCQKMGTRVALI